MNAPSALSPDLRALVQEGALTVPQAAEMMDSNQQPPTRNRKGRPAMSKKDYPPTVVLTGPQAAKAGVMIALPGTVQGQGGWYVDFDGATFKFEVSDGCNWTDITVSAAADEVEAAAAAAAEMMDSNQQPPTPPANGSAAAAGGHEKPKETIFLVRNVRRLPAFSDVMNETVMRATAMEETILRATRKVKVRRAPTQNVTRKLETGETIRVSRVFVAHEREYVEFADKQAGFVRAMRVCALQTKKRKRNFELCPGSSPVREVGAAHARSDDAGVDDSLAPRWLPRCPSCSPAAQAESGKLQRQGMGTVAANYCGLCGKPIEKPERAAAPSSAGAPATAATSAAVTATTAVTTAVAVAAATVPPQIYSTKLVAIRVLTTT